MSWQACAWVTQQTVTATATDQLVLLVLANYAGEDGRNAFPSIARLAREARLTERAVQKSLRRLEDASLIRQGNQKVAEAHIDRKDKRPTVYDLNLSLLEISTVSTGDGVNHVHPILHLTTIRILQRVRARATPLTGRAHPTAKRVIAERPRQAPRRRPTRLDRKGLRNGNAPRRPFPRLSASASGGSGSSSTG